MITAGLLQLRTDREDSSFLLQDSTERDNQLLNSFRREAQIKDHFQSEGFQMTNYNYI